MTYVISDLHGCYEEYIKMLNLINFNDDDTLYILGDICDRGESPMKILLHMLEHDNIIPIYGNHDISALNSLSKIGLKSKEVIDDMYYVVTHDLMDSDEYNDYLYWLIDGGKDTLIDYDKLSVSNKNKVLRYLSDFRDYAEIKVNNIDYVLIHGGFKDFDESKELFEYSLSELINERLDYDKVYYKNKILTSGHTPTKFIDSNMSGKIVKKNNHIAIDCGCVFGYSLGCICLDTMKEYYIEVSK